MKRPGARERRQQRQVEAVERQSHRDSRSIEQQLEELDKRGCTATRERQRLLAKLQKETTRGKKKVKA